MSIGHALLPKRSRSGIAFFDFQHNRSLGDISLRLATPLLVPQERTPPSSWMAGMLSAAAAHLSLRGGDRLKQSGTLTFRKDFIVPTLGHRWSKGRNSLSTLPPSANRNCLCQLSPKNGLSGNLVRDFQEVIARVAESWSLETAKSTKSPISGLFALNLLSILG
jgi:hypothetical protein